MNRHQRLQLQGWRANCDLNIIIDYHSCIEYLTKYTSKAENLSSVVRDAFVSVISKLSDQTSATKQLKIDYESSRTERYECTGSHASNPIT